MTTLAAMARHRPGPRTVLVLVAVMVAVVTLALTNTPVVYQPENLPMPDSFLLFGH
jgi:hypothetical protein